MIRWNTFGLFGLLLLAFGVFLGVQLASGGVERIHGPTGRMAETVSAAAPSGWNGRLEREGWTERVDRMTSGESVAHVPEVRLESDTLINRIGNKTGDLLQIVAYHTIESVVTFFDGMFD